MTCFTEHVINADVSPRVHPGVYAGASQVQVGWWGEDAHEVHNTVDSGFGVCPCVCVRVDRVWLGVCVVCGVRRVCVCASMCVCACG